jgi:glycosyltransferase involved in cell wall biosynthesis
MFLEKWHSHGGGIQRVNTNLANAIEVKGISTVFYVFDAYSDKSDGFKDLKQKVCCFAPLQSDSFIKKISHLFRTIRQQNIGYIIAATETANMLAAICVMRFPSLSVIYTRHCAFDVSDQKLSPSKIKVLYNLYALTGKTIGAVSKSLKNEIIENLLFRKASVHFLPNAVVDMQIKGLSCENTDNVNYTNYICAVGRMAEQKGFDLLIDAYASAFKKSKDKPTFPNLVIVGDGELLGALKQQLLETGIDEKVILHGFTSNPYYIIANSHAFILSSRHEGMPTVLIESLYLNVPVISFDCPTGPSEIIENGKNGFLIENGCVDSLAEAIGDRKWEAISKVDMSVGQFEFTNAANSYLSKLGITAYV